MFFFGMKIRPEGEFNFGGVCSDLGQDGSVKIMLTNDDGVFADGIQALRREIVTLEGAEVYLVAPDRERSATGHAITVHRPLHVKQLPFPDGAGAWSVTGTPADCVKLALEALLPGKPDLVISGINRGPNLGTDVFYSGTVSAAIEATFAGIPSMAVSIGDYDHVDYSLAASFSRWIARKILSDGLPPGTLLNINVPATDEEHLAGVDICKLGVRLYKDVFDRRVDPRGKVYYWLAGDLQDLENDPDTDVVALQQNMIAVTPIQLDLTNHALVSELKSWNLGRWAGKGRAVDK